MDSMVRAVRNKIATLDLSNFYDNVVSKGLLEDCDQDLDHKTTAMLSACLQPLRVTRNGDVLGGKAVITFGLTQWVFIGRIPDPLHHFN